MMRALATLLAAAAIACSGATPPPKPDTSYLTVFVAKDGALEVDGRQGSLSDLEGALQAAVASGSVVLFAREPPERDRASIGMTVLRMLRERKLQVRLCRERDFSDAIGPDGRLRPE